MVERIEAIFAELGGPRMLGRVRNEQELAAAIRIGFPPAVVERVMESAGLNLKELAASLDLSPRSLQRRRAHGRLASHESDRLYRLARIVALAKQQIGDDESAARWLKAANRALGGKRPLDLLDTEPGARSVEDVLGRIAYGGIS
jgi:putative toxin-antitoxin system antitoxin component (TIGR02293 family)